MSLRNNSPETRASLILRLRNTDDMQAWQEFVEIYQPVIRSLAMKRGLQVSDADDVTQEVFSRVANHIDGWISRDNTGRSFRAWLATITRNQTIQFFRKRSQRPVTGVDSQVDRQMSNLDEDEFDLEQDRQLFAWASRRVQNQFQAATWQAFWLTAVEELSIPAVAKKLNTTVAMVYVSRSRVMTALKKAILQSQFESQVERTKE